MALEEPYNEEALGEAIYKQLTVVLKALNSTSTQVITQGLTSVLNDKDVKKSLRDGVMVYVYAAGLLSYSGREINRENLSRSVGALGIKPNSKLIDIVLKTGVKSRLIYIYAFYFILASGGKGSKENVSKVVESMGMKVDSTALDDVMGMMIE